MIGCLTAILTFLSISAGPRTGPPVNKAVAIAPTPPIASTIAASEAASEVQMSMGRSPTVSPITRHGRAGAVFSTLAELIHTLAVTKRDGKPSFPGDKKSGMTSGLRTTMPEASW